MSAYILFINQVNWASRAGNIFFNRFNFLTPACLDRWMAGSCLLLEDVCCETLAFDVDESLFRRMSLAKPLLLTWTSLTFEGRLWRNAYF